MKSTPNLDVLEKPESDVNQLLERVSEGDRQAFRQIYYLFAGELNKYVYLFTRSAEDTEDVLQEVFVKLWEKRQTLPHITSFRGYLYRMARNHVLNHIRSAKIKIQTEALSERDEQQYYEADAADQLVYKQYQTLVSQAIDLLPYRRKEVFLMNLNEGLSQQEIADRLRVSKSAVKQHLYIAARFIREYLQKHGGPAATLTIFLALFF